METKIKNKELGCPSCGSLIDVTYLESGERLWCDICDINIIFINTELVEA